MAGKSGGSTNGLDAYAPRLVAEWLGSHPHERHRRLTGTMAFVDISGFTALTEQLARRGKVGAELMSDTLNTTFGTLLTAAFDEGADLIKWGGDAVLLLFQGTDHAARGARAGHRMRADLRGLVRRGELPVPARLRMSIGVHSGDFDAFLVGDPTSHRELIVTGPEVTELAALEHACAAGQIGVSGATAALLPERVLGVGVDGLAHTGARLLRSRPTAAPAPVDVDRPGFDITPALPPTIRAHLLAASGQPEHRPVTVGFVRFTGTDEVLRRRGPAALGEAVDELISNVQRACLDHDVTFFESDLDQDGGKVMLTAGAPHSTGHDAERMLRTARDIVDRGGVLDVRLGVNRGHVFAGDFGPAVRRTYSIKGDAVNLAARLLGRALPGEVIATPEVTSRSHTLVTVEPLEPFMVKGKREPVHAVRVQGVVEGRTTPGAEPAFIGREQELRRLRAAVDAAMSRRGSMIDVVGEPGIGKSRLVAELAPLPSGMTMLTTSSSSYDSGTPYVAFRLLLRSLFGIGPHDPVEAVAERLADRVRGNAPQLLPWLPMLAVPLDVDLPETPETRDVDPKFRRGRLEQVTVDLLGALLPTPTLLLFEDTHLMDEASGALLRRLEAEAAQHPWCVIMTRRETPIGFVPSPTAPGAEQIVLEPLPDDLAVDLLESSVADSRVSVHAFEAMAAKANGNPLFLTSLATLARHTGEMADLPSSVEAVLLAEIDRLDPAERTLLRFAAVLGNRFDTRVFWQLFPDLVIHGEMRQRLGEFLRPVDDDVLEFRHSMVRDVAYAGLPFRLRREMHERVALALETSPDGSAGEPEVLSLHFHAAGLHDKSWTYSLLAGHDAQAKYAHGEAADFFGRALDSATHLSGLAPEARSAAYVSLGDCLDLAGESVEALAAFGRARRALRRDVVATTGLLYKEARIRMRMGRFQTTLALLTRALRLLDGTEGPAADAVRATLTTRYGFCRHLQGRPEEAIRWSTLGVKWAEASGDVESLANSYNTLHLAYGSSTYEEDRPYGQLALAAYERLEDLSGQALCVNNLAIDAYNAGRWGEAIEMFRRAAESFRRLGDSANEGNASYNHADVLVAQRRFAEALPVLRSALRLARGVDDEELVGLVLREGARAHAGVGNVDQADELFDQARAVLDDLHLPVEIAILDAARAVMLTGLGRFDEALALLDETLHRARAKAPDVVTRLLRVRSHTLLAAGRPDEAARAARQGLAQTIGNYGGYEPALLRLALAAATEDCTLRAEAREVLDALGVAT